MATIVSSVEQAAQQFRARKERASHPDGTFDRAGRWYPSQTERQACCDGIRYPSRSFPYSYMVHCRSAEHVARLNGVDARDVRRAARKSN